MVMRRSDIKRISKDVSDTLEDNPKRTKVHAQRKFAQGSGMNSPVMTPIKDKEKTKVNGTSSSPELLPSKRPRTEDFLTYLCFRGTEALPPRLDFFNQTSKSNKDDKEGSSPGSSKQISSSQQESKVKKVKQRLKSTKVVHALKNKLHEKRLGTRSPRLAQKSSSTLITRPRKLGDRQKKVNKVTTSKQLVRGRPAHHPSILKRLEATRLRTGLRSGGQLPPGSDIGIKSDRKPRKKLMRAKVNKAKKEAITRAKISRRKLDTTNKKHNESENEEEEEEEIDYEEDKEKEKKKVSAIDKKKEEDEDAEESDPRETVNDEPALKKSCRMSTRSRASSGSPAHPPNTLSLSSRPSRKTKEAATLYMEMLTKDLRSPEDEEDEGFIKGSPENISSTKRSDVSPEPNKVSLKKSKNKNNDQQFTNKEKRQTDVQSLSRSTRRGRMKLRDNNRFKREDVRVTRGQTNVQQWSRGRPSLRRGRGRPPLTRTPIDRRVLRNVRKVTNFAEDESETEDEEDEMFVESILSEEMERLEMGPGRLKPAKSSTSLAKSERNNLKNENDSHDEQESPGQEIEEKTFTKRKTRGSANSALLKPVNDSSEEDTKRQTRSSKDKEVKDRKRGLPSRKNRLDNSESDIEKINFSQKEKPISKRGRKDSHEKAKDSLEKEKHISSSKAECSSKGKKSILEEKKGEGKEEKQESKDTEDSSARVSGNQSDQSVAYLLLSLAQSERWPESENDCCSNGENSAPSRSTRSSLKDFPKEEARGRRGRWRNTSLDSGVINDKAEEEKPTGARKGKRESVSSESLIKGKTRSSSKVSIKKEGSDLQSDDEQNVSVVSKANRSEDLDLKKESVINKNKMIENKSSSDSEDDKSIKRKNVKNNNEDGSSAFSSRRDSKPRKSNKVNENISDSEDDIKLNMDSKIKSGSESKKEKRNRKKGVVKKRESLELEDSETDIKPDLKNIKKIKKSGTFQKVETASVDTKNESQIRNKMQEAMSGNFEIPDSADGTANVKEELPKSEGDNTFKKEKDSKLLEANKDASEGKRKQVMIRKTSADSNASHSSFVDCKVLLEPIDVAEPYVKKINEKANVGKSKETNFTLGNNNELLKDGCRKRVDLNEEGSVQLSIKPTVSEKSTSLGQNINENEIRINTVESNYVKTQNNPIKSDISSSDESEEEMNIKSEKELLESRGNFGSRKRFPRRSRMEYFSNSNNKEVPTRKLHSRKVKSVNERYVDEESYSSDISSTSEESRVTTIKSQKRIKPKNSTQNDAIESALREAQNAVSKKEQKVADIVCQSSKVDPVSNKNLFNLATSAPGVIFKKEISSSAHQVDIKDYPQVSIAEHGETKPMSIVKVVFESSSDKAGTTHEHHKIEKSNENSLLAKSLPLQDTKFFELEHVSPSNPVMKTNVFNTTADNTVKQVSVGESKKQSMSETWRQAFKNAKIPKPGQSSPVPQGVKPFFRKSFGGPTLGTKLAELKSINPNLPKMSNALSQFKTTTFQSLGKYSPNRPYPSGEDPVKSQSPSRRAIEVRDSPSKSSVSSSDDSRVLSSDSKKNKELPVKSLTQLQYEKRSSDVISSLKDAPIIIDPSCPVAPFTSKLKEAAAEATPQRSAKPASSSPLKPASEGKHLHLPLAVEHTLRKKMSPITVSKKSLIKNTFQADKKTPTPFSDKQKELNDETKEDSIKSGSNIEETSAPRTSNIEMLGKKKVNMTTEEIKRWLDDSTSSGIEHAKDCGIFEKNECECSFRTSGASMLVGRGGTVGENTSEVTDNRGLMTCGQQNISNTSIEFKVDRGFVEPPVQLRELAEIASKYGGEIISSCKVDDYRERVMTKSKDISVKQPKRPPSAFKSDRSMTEEEMCEFDFRFDRNSNSPRESGSEMSSPPPLRDDISEKSDLQHSSPSERKPIFQQRRSCGIVLKRPPQSKSPAAAFSAENESSVYAFQPEEAPVSVLDKPFRRRSSKGTRDDETPSIPSQQPPSSSIAVQVNLESEAVLETEAVLECCTTQTEHSQDDEENGSGGRSFYIPIEQSTNQLTPQQTIKGVTLKVESEGPNNQRVMLRAKLVTKPPSTFATPSTSHRSLIETNTESGGNSISSGRRRPEQKVRPLSARAPPPVGTVQPTVREGTDQNITSVTIKPEKPRQASQGTQSSPRPSSTNTVVAKLPEPPESSGVLKSKTSVGKAAGSNQCSPEESGNILQLHGSGNATMLEAPTFYPTEKEFGDPLEYIEKITPLAQHLGICRIVPPPNFKPECKVSDDMRFTAYNQYIHKMLHRWGPNVREMSAIRKYLATQNIALNQPPWIGGMEVDLPRLYQTVQQCGGLKEVYEKKRWTKVADVMKIPRSAQDRVTKLDDIYCKFLLPYDTLSHSERSKLLEEVELEWREREKRMMEQDEDVEKEEGTDNESDTDERDECITKGKSVALSGFYRIARNTMSMWFSKDSTPSPDEVENEFWRHVTGCTAHVCVHSGSIDTATWGCGFPTGKERSSARHPWNLKILTNNPRSILRSLGPVIGVTVPTLHVGMLFSACCWYRDPHALPWIEYLHTGASKIWYGVPDSWSEELKVAVKRLMPRYCRDKKKIWLASDTVMVPPQLLVAHGVSVCRTVQEPGHFVVVFPRAFTSSLCTGYLVSESVYFAHPSWLDTSRSVFKDIQDSCEPPIFSLEKLLFNIATDIRSSAEVLTQILPLVIELRNEEVSRRKVLEGFGLVADEKLPVTKGRRTKSQEEPNEYECEICRGNLFLSLVTNTQDEINYCLVHAIEVITKDKDLLKYCKLMYAYDEEEMEELIEKIKTKIEIKNQKKQGKNSNTSSSSKS